MDYIGLLSKFKVNRPLTEEERTLQLKPERRLNVEPLNQLSTIRMNSTYLEMVDKFFAWKGFVTLFSLAMISAFTVAFLALVAISFQRFDTLTTDAKMEEIAFLAFIFAMSLPFILVGFWLFRKESFAYTHYPIRLNRKNGKIYVFRLDGTVLAMPWKDVFFTVGKGRPLGTEHDIRGHVLDADCLTVKETFALSDYGTLTEEDKQHPARQEKNYLHRYWEFVRRYMDEGPKNLIGQVEMVLPIAYKREPVAFSFHRFNANWDFLWLPMLPITLLVWPCRVLAMRTSKIPQWPQWVEDECQVDPNDPYQRDEQHPQPASA